jgi:hypothetical protein
MGQRARAIDRCGLPESLPPTFWPRDFWSSGMSWSTLCGPLCLSGSLNDQPLSAAGVRLLSGAYYKVWTLALIKLIFLSPLRNERPPQDRGDGRSIERVETAR